MRAGVRKIRTPARIASDNENTLPKLFGGVVRQLFKFAYAVLHYIHWALLLFLIVIGLNGYSLSLVSANSFSISSIGSPVAF